MIYHPCSKEFQENAKKLGLSGYQYMRKLVEEGRLPDPTKIKRIEHENTIKNARYDSRKEYADYRAQRKGYKDEAERVKKYRHDTGKNLSMEENKEYPSHLGIYIAERNVARNVLPIIFGKIKKEMPPNNIGFDFIVEEDKTNKTDIKIDVKSSRLQEISGDPWSYRWKFHIKHNKEPDYFLLIGFNSEYTDDDKLIPLNIWLFRKDEILRGNIFWKYEAFSIVDKPYYLSKLSVNKIKI